MAGSIFSRRLGVGAGFLALLALPLLPPQHVHHSDTADGAHTDLIHRHVEAHHQAATGAGIDHPDGDVAQWIALACVGPEPVRVVPAPQFLIAELSALEPPQFARRVLSSDHDSVHDPPWAATHDPRGPPTPRPLAA